MPKGQKLELTWIGKEERPNLEPRILIEDPEKSYGDSKSENMLIHGDNLLALKALEQDYAGKVKCIFIDPPYNTGNAFDHYDDGIEHSLWLNLISVRLKILWSLLSIDGSIWITIDDTECHYLKVLCDEIMGRSSFVCSFAWEKDQARHNDALISSSHDHILLYVKNKDIWRQVRNLQPREKANDQRYKNTDNDPMGPWLQGACSTAKSGSEKNRFSVTLPSGRKIVPPQGNYWRFSEKRLKDAINENRVYFGKDGDGLPIIKTYLSEVQAGYVPKTWWPASEVGSNQSAKRDHLRKLLEDIEPFATPKPEGLIARIIHISTIENDIVLDSFLGSGTTASVAHKMKRHWIGIELGRHCLTHCIPRLKKVCDGLDQGGICQKRKQNEEIILCKKCKELLCNSCKEMIEGEDQALTVDWKGGGGFKYYYLAPSLLKQDTHGNWIIDERYNPDMLAAAMAKHEGFKYCPHEEIYWKQGQSTELDYIFTTTQFVTVEMLDRIASEMVPNESLLVCCRKFSSVCKTRHENITIKKIPNMLLGRCEFGKDDYSLNIINMPRDPDDPEYVPPGPPSASVVREKKAAQIDLFDSPENVEEEAV